ncbi:preprotein translocase subunit SecD [Caloramator fervidus]|uniref:Protein translocase subunit SecD n=1 Tax=Caloramator fervidus TaxID=29344 RepID=A0A1H5W076_9CLOT|nr:protein translocase subunit SecD [Caloramator fervidus]SEF92636.1 preprotein translocase subunit SecD [Caloramator fervidus]
MKTRDRIKFILSVFLIFFVSYVLLFGIVVGDYQVKPLSKVVKLGLDLKGGVYVEEEIVDKNVSKDTVERTRDLIELRVNSLGVSEPVVAITGSNRIRVEIPGIYDPKAALEQIGRTGKLRFVGPNNDEILTGKDVKDAVVSVDQRTNAPVVQLKLNQEGAKKFAEATKKYLGKQIAIYMDDELISAPTVRDVIPNGEAIITGSRNVEEAKRLAGIIKSGALPVKLYPATIRAIGPSLGAEAIPTSLKAATIGIILVMLFMLVYYKIPGFIADLALIVYMIITALIFTVVLKTTLTLPGIAGLLLSIGMAVDANVLIFERIKEELRLGKSLRTAIDAGFKRAFSSILDSNITTLIAGFVLYFVGTGAVKGFALTLIIGVLSSMFTAITVTRFLLKSFVNSGWITNSKFYGA